jgi:hypothetical protein
LAKSAIQKATYELTISDFKEELGTAKKELIAKGKEHDAAMAEKDEQPAGLQQVGLFAACAVTMAAVACIISSSSQSDEYTR